MIEVLIIALLLAFILWYMIHPGKPTKEQREMVFGGNYAHRGLHSMDKIIPENSLSAFKLAVQKGYGIELDVTLSKDGKVMVFHDDTLDRVCGVRGNIEDYTFDKLREMRLCNTEEKIPLLEEVLQAVDGKSPLIVEIKTGKRNDELCEKTLKILESYSGPYCVESFNPLIVTWFKKNAPKIMRGQLAMNRKEYKDLPKWMTLAMASGFTNVLARPHFIAYGTSPKSIFIKMAEKLGAIKVVWTVNNSHDFKEFEKSNDAVIFEYYEPKPRYK